MQQREKVRWWNRPSITDYCLTAFTLILAGVAIYQGAIMRRQLRDSQKQFTAAHRPWMGAVNQKINIGPDGTPITWVVEWKNFGSSPAFGVDWYSRLARLSAGFDWSTVQLLEETIVTNQQMGVVFPGDSELEEAAGKSHIGIPGIPLAAGERERIYGGSEIVILVGKISYLDDSQRRHITSFCREFRPAENGMPDKLLGCQVPDYAD